MAGSVPRGIRKRINSAGLPRYQVRYLVRDSDSPSGWAETSSTFATLREARAFKADRDGEAAIGARRFDPRLGRAKLAAVWTQYSALKRPAVSPKTWSGYTQHWELRISPRFGHVPVDEISRKDIQQFIDSMTVGPWAKLATLRLLRSILDMAREDGRIHSNPADGVIRADTHPRTPPLSDRHRSRRPGSRMRRPRRRGDHPRLHRPALVRTRRPAGRRHRPNCASALCPPGRARSGRPDHRRAAKNSRRRPNRPTPQIVIDALKPRIDNRAPTEHAITSPNGGFLRSNNWRRHTDWNEALKKTGLVPLTIHDLRHTYASLARASGADLRYVQKTMGHSTPTVTANIYSDLYSDELDHVATNLDRLQDVAKNRANGQEPDTPNHP